MNFVYIGRYLDANVVASLDSYTCEEALRLEALDLWGVEPDSPSLWVQKILLEENPLGGDPCQMNPSQ